MALTDIARQLKDTFEDFGGADLHEEVTRFKEIYGDAESIRIGEMDYIVINEEYKSEEYSDLPSSISPLFFNSINNSFAIIDAKTSSTLIDEAYSRVTYMQRVYKLEATPDKKEIRDSLSGIIGEGENVTDVLINADGEGENKANIFQCQLIKDTGVSAAHDVYSFIVKNGEIKEIADSVMRRIKRSGEVSLLKERDQLEKSHSAIQQAVFDKYIQSDIDIQSINVKSIFEISMAYLNIHLLIDGGSKKTGVYNTSYLAGENNEFEALNANIHVCNSCGHDLVDVRDPNKVYRLHVNSDAYDKEFTTDDRLVYATGCEDCLTQCPDCGKWHFNYEKFLGSRIYDKVNLVPGRAFIKGLRSIEGNYCACREGIEWVYDEKSGTDTEHDIIPVENVAFINTANEKVADYEDYAAFYNREERRAGVMNGEEESAFAKRTLSKFKKLLADRFDTDIKDIKISSREKCTRCSVCGGEYYKGVLAGDDDFEYRCEMCEEMVTEKLRVATRIDGVVFMRRTKGRNNIISKYIVTKLGNLKKLSSNTGIAEEQPVVDGEAE